MANGNGNGNGNGKVVGFDGSPLADAEQKIGQLEYEVTMLRRPSYGPQRSRETVAAEAERLASDLCRECWGDRGLTLARRAAEVAQDARTIGDREASDVQRPEIARDKRY